MSRGLRVVLVIRAGDLAPVDQETGYERVLVVPEGIGAADVLGRLETYGIPREFVRACVAFHDNYHELALSTCELLGLRYPFAPEGIRLTKDKDRAREIANRISSRPVAAVRFHAVDESVRALLNSGAPAFVAKPLNGSGSRSVRAVRDESELAVHLASSEYAGPWLLEEWITGDEYSVEAFSTKGQHHVLGVTEKHKFTGTLVEREHRFGRLPDAGRERAIREFTTALLDAVGVTDGPTHTEVLVNDEGVFLVESHCRIGGDYIWALVEQGTGLNLDELMAAQCLGEPIVLDPPEFPRGVGVVRYVHVHTPGGVIERIDGLEAARALPGVTALDVAIGPGRPTVPLTESSSRNLVVVVHEDTREEALGTCAKALSRIDIEVGITPSYRE
ncbi:ATP-grasp domain-containing protein [Streptomyces venezuelae]|uniref:ATP-grasp domain-containing protein n=1 Tax=Streptomyces venezuelae TaxID=54571 RepID=UPI003663F36D